MFLAGPSSELPNCDFYLPLLSAPYALGTNATTIPREVPYVWADPVLTEFWRAELAKIEGLRIGIAWQGRHDFVWDRSRSIPLAQFAPLARVPGVHLISLQKGFGAEQIGQVDFPILDLAGRLDETSGAFIDTAAVIRNLDLVIAPDTAIAHLAGALGAPVFLALSLAADWRWLLRPRGLALVSDHAALPPKRAGPMARRVSATSPRRPSRSAPPRPDRRRQD